MSVRGRMIFDVIACGARSLIALGAFVAIALALQVPADAGRHKGSLDATTVSGASVRRGTLVFVSACTGRVIGDDATSSQHTCCCHTPSQIACEPTTQCATEHGSCLRADWGVCHFPSLNQKTIRR